MARIKTDYFILKKVKVIKTGEFVPFETKMPGKANCLTGYQISASKHHDTLAMANVGISFNGATVNTINQELINRNPANIRRRSLPLSQNMIPLNNSWAKGFVEDLGVVTVPYTVNIYFKLSRD